MQKVLLIGCLLALLLATPSVAAERGQDELRRDMQFAREQVYPALVNIAVITKVHRNGRTMRFFGAGSGAIVSPAGHVITNYHVAEHATQIVCRLPSGESIDADVVAHDPLTDLSVLKLKLDTREDRNAALPFARIGNSDALETGDYVLAMGNPLTLSSSMTLGIVSNPKRVFATLTGSEMGEMELGEGQLTGLLTRWIQHDALILPGNSGGPLVNLRGEIVGVNELGGRGVGFAIPANLVAKVLNQALAHGEIVRGWLGIELAHTEKLNDRRGVLIAFAQPGGAAAEAGIEAGARLLAIDGEPTVGRSIEDLPVLYARFADLAPGQEVALRIEQDGEARTKTVTVGKMGCYLTDAVEDKTLGLTLRDITGPMAMLRRYPDARGVLVTGVRPGKAAAEARPGLQRGDVIRELNGTPIEDYASYRKAVAAFEKGGRPSVLARRGDAEVLTVLDLEKSKPPLSGGELAKAWLGIRTQVVTPAVAQALGHEGTRGFRITQVYPATKAADAGIRVGDLITALDGKALEAYRVQDSELLKRRIEGLTIGQVVNLTVLRDGAEQAVDVELQETPPSADEAKRASDELLEYGVRSLTFSDRITKRWPMDQRGVLVTEVTTGGWAQLAGLRSGDLLLRLNDTPMEGLEDFEAEVKRTATKDVTPVVLFVRRGYRTKFLFAEPDHD